MPQPSGRNWLNTLFLWGTLVAAAVAVPWHLAVNGFVLKEWVAFLAMTFLCGTAISLGYHRLFSHRAFKASLPVRLFGLLFGAANFENSVLQWGSDHRIHHRYCDDLDKDPYAIGRGFWWAHWGWVMKGESRPIQNVADLEKDPLVMWQHRHIFPIGAAVALLPLLFARSWREAIGMAVVAVLLRIVVNHHTTFFINSMAHMIGSRPYNEATSARDSWILAPLTYGEGYHNFHHTWQWDYRNGVKWWQWDSTKWILGALNGMGLVTDLRRVDPAALDRAEVALEQVRLARRLCQTSPLQVRLQEAALRLDEALATLQKRREAWRRLKADLRAQGQAKAEQWQQARAEWKAAFAQHQSELAQAWAEWKAARQAALAAVPAAA